MIFKCIIVLVALSTIPTQGFYVQHASLRDSLTEMLKVLKTVSDAGVVNLDAALQEFTTTEQQKLLHFLDDSSDTLSEEVLCLLELVKNSDAETQATAEEFIKESMNWIELTQQRDRELQACEDLLGDSPGVSAVAQYQACRMQVQATTGAAVTVSAARSRLLFWELRSLHVEGFLCIAGLL